MLCVDIGLIKSIDSFDASKGYKFSTFAVLLIIREIASFMRKNNKYLMTESLDKTISLQEEKIQYTSMDTLKEPSNTENDYINQEIYRTIHSIVASLPLKDRQIIEMYFGFHDQEPMRQSEIANVMHVSQSLISRKIKQNVEKISVLLQEAGIIEEQKQSRLKKS